MKQEKRLKESSIITCGTRTGKQEVHLRNTQLNRMKTIEHGVSSKEDLEKLNNLASDITGAMGFATEIEKLIKKYRELEMET